MAASDSIYQEIADDVNAVLADLGTTYTITANSQYDEATMTSTPGTTRQVSGLVADQSIAANMGQIGAIEWVAKRTLILSADASPQPNEKVTVDGEVFSLSNIQPIKPADVTVVYLLDITK